MERAGLTPWRTRATVIFADGDQLGVIVLPVIETRGPRVLVQGRFAEPLHFLVARRGGTPSMSYEDPVRVGVDYETGMAAGVEEEAIGRLGADAVDAKQSLSNRGPIAAEQEVEPAVAFDDEDMEESVQPTGFDIRVAGGADELCELTGGESVQRARSEQPTEAEAIQSALDAAPGGVLSEDGPNADLERRIAGPPMLVTVAPTHESVGLPEGRSGRGERCGALALRHPARVRGEGRLRRQRFVLIPQARATHQPRAASKARNAAAASRTRASHGKLFNQAITAPPSRTMLPRLRTNRPRPSILGAKNGFTEVGVTHRRGAANDHRPVAWGRPPSWEEPRLRDLKSGFAGKVALQLEFDAPCRG